jgi:radical SAM superfamily enzyme YgiQ (UPF0313 family)
MNILMVYPELPETYCNFKYALKFIRKQASNPPLGLCTVAALLPESWDKRLVDLNVSKLASEDFEWADCVFLSGMILQRDSAADVISKSNTLGIPVVAGGPLFTMEFESFPGVDHFVLNEAELTLPRFIEDFTANEAQRIYRTDQFANLQYSPTPIWELIKMNRYASMSIQFSRGCPYDCDFCNVTTLLGRKPRVKDPAQILAELDSLYALGWRGRVFFVDDNFICHRKAVKGELLPALIEWRQKNKGISFSTQASIDLVDDRELMSMMVEAGFCIVFVGIETPNEESLAECNKKHNLERDLVADVKRIQRAGLQVHGGFIVGFDHDTPSIFQCQIDFIQRSGIVMAMVGMLQAPAGTKLYDRLDREGRLLPNISGDNVDGSTNIIPLMGYETLLEGYKEVLSTIYMPEVYYRRAKSFLQEYTPRSNNFSWEIRPILEYISAFLRSIYYLGIIGEERSHYWKLLIWTILHRPKLFPLAVTVSIYGYHFRMISELRV